MLGVRPQQPAEERANAARALRCVACLASLARSSDRAAVRNGTWASWCTRRYSRRLPAVQGGAWQLFEAAGEGERLCVVPACHTCGSARQGMEGMAHCDFF